MELARLESIMVKGSFIVFFLLFMLYFSDCMRWHDPLQADRPNSFRSTNSSRSTRKSLLMKLKIFGLRSMKVSICCNIWHYAISWCVSLFTKLLKNKTLYSWRESVRRKRIKSRVYWKSQKWQTEKYLMSFPSFLLLQDQANHASISTFLISAKRRRKAGSVKSAGARGSTLFCLDR